MFDCTNIYSVWDKRLVRGIKNYRRQAKQVEYKGNRDVKKNEHVFSFEDDTSELLSSVGVKNIYPGILEADDVISWLCSKIDGSKVVVSVDQDMLQLVDKKTTVYSPIKDIMYDVNNFNDQIGVPVEQFLRYKSLMGDKSDNLPGINKCGPKTAQKLVAKHPTDETLIKELGEDKLQPYFFNLKMIDLTEGHRQHPDDVELYDDQYKVLQDHQPDFETFESLCEAHGIKKITGDVHNWKQVFDPINLDNTLEIIVNKLDLHK